MLNNTAGPNKTGLTLVMYLYNSGFVTGDLGYASAIGWTLALGVLTVSLAQMRLTGAWKGSEVSKASPIGAAPTESCSGRALTYTLLLFSGAIALTPMLWLVAATTKGRTTSSSYLLRPKAHHVRTEKLFSLIPFWRYVTNSVFITSTIVTIGSSSPRWPRFALAKYDFRGKQAVMVLMLATMMIPGPR